MKHAGGRPTIYKKEYVGELLKYFNVDPSFEVPVDFYDKQGNIKKSTVTFVANDLPTLAGFASKIGVHRETLNNWGEEHEEFFDAIKRAKDFQENILVSNALGSRYNPAFSIFFAKNNLGWKDRSDITTDDEPIKIDANAMLEKAYGTDKR